MRDWLTAVAVIVFMALPSAGAESPTEDQLAEFYPHPMER